MSLPCARCGHEIRHHGRGTGKCWAPNLRCTCPAYVKPEETAAVDGTIVHELPREDVARAYAAGLLVLLHPLSGELP